MKKRNLWPELVVCLLLLSVVWRLVGLSFIPAASRELYKKYPIFSAIPTVVESLKAKPPASPTPFPTLTPAPDVFYIKLAMDDITQPESFTAETLVNVTVKARLVLISKVPTTLPNGTVNTNYVSNMFCVGLVAFLDADGLRMESYDKEKTKYVLLALGMDDLAPYGEGLPAREKIYLMPDPNCGNN